MSNNVKLAEQIKKLRQSKKMTLAVMAERLGVTTSAVAAYENGSRNPSFDVLITIARIFNVTVDNLLGDTNKDFIDVSGLIPEQRDYVEILISTFQKFNMLLDETMEVKNSHKHFGSYFDSNAEDLKEQIETTKRVRKQMKELEEKRRKKNEISKEDDET